MILDTIEKGVNFPVIHILRITEPPTPSSTTNNTSTTTTHEATQNANKRTSVNLAKPLSLYEPKSVAFVEGCEHPDKHRNVQLASIKLHPTDELGADTYLMQGRYYVLGSGNEINRGISWVLKYGKQRGPGTK